MWLPDLADGFGREFVDLLVKRGPLDVETKQGVFEGEEVVVAVGKVGGWVGGWMEEEKEEERIVPVDRGVRGEGG